MGASTAVATLGLGLMGALGMHASSQPGNLPDGVWQTLLAHAFTLVDEIARRGTSDPFWTRVNGSS
jgi:hypothetical protein